MLRLKYQKISLIWRILINHKLSLRNEKDYNLDIITKCLSTRELALQHFS